MHLVPRKTRILLTNRPFAGALGAKLYAGIGSAGSIQYRPQKTWVPKCPTINCLFANDSSIATVLAPANSFSYAVPSAWHGQSVFLQVREFQGGYENESIWRPVELLFDGSGNSQSFLSGTCFVLGVDLVDGGAATVRISWVGDAGSLPVTSFSAVYVSGPTNFGTVSVFPVPGRIQRIGITGLATGTYSCNITATNGANSVVIGIATFTVAPAPYGGGSFSFEES